MHEIPFSVVWVAIHDLLAALRKDSQLEQLRGSFKGQLTRCMLNEVSCGLGTSLCLSMLRLQVDISFTCWFADEETHSERLRDILLATQ